MPKGYNPNINRHMEFIYFEIGGVVVLDFSKTNKWKQMLEDLKIPDSRRTAFHELFLKHEPDICKGESIDVFIGEAKEELDIDFPENYSMLEDFVSRFEKNPKLSNFLLELEKLFPLGLLTNMYPGMFDNIKNRGLLPDVNFKQIIDSSIVKYKKPESEIFEIAEERAGISAENILFVENTLEHIDAATKRGWQTLLYDIDRSTRELKEYLGLN